MAGERKTPEKSAWFNFVSYDPDCVQKMRDKHVCFAWVYHDKDQEHPTSEEDKTAHWHFLVHWGNSTTVNHAHACMDDVAANGWIECTMSPRGYYRYLCHEDNPEKFQYPKNERHCENGFSETDLYTVTDTNQIIHYVMTLIWKLDIYDYDDLLQRLNDMGMLSELFVVVHNTIHFEAMMKSRRCRRAAEIRKNVKEDLEKIRGHALDLDDPDRVGEFETPECKAEYTKEREKDGKKKNKGRKDSGSEKKETSCKE